MSKVQIKVNDNGSLRITGEVELLDGAGNVMETKPAFSLAAAGFPTTNLFVMVLIKGNLTLKCELQKKSSIFYRKRTPGM